MSPDDVEGWPPTLRSPDDVEGGPPALRSGVFPVSDRQTGDAAGRDAAHRIVDLVGRDNARTLLRILRLPDPDRLAFVARLYQRPGGDALAEVLTDVESDPDDLVRLRLIGGLRALLGTSA
jgi:hypothetical protein